MKGESISGILFSPDPSFQKEGNGIRSKLFTQENVGAGNLSLPQNEMHTTAYWLTVPAPLLQSLPFSSEEKVNGLFDLEKDLLRHGLKTINVCPCQEGYPSCVGPSRETGRQAKQVAQEILRGLLEE